MSSNVPSYPTPDIVAKRRLLKAPIKVSLTTTAAKNTNVLSSAMYAVMATCNWYCLQGASNVSATTSASFYLYAGQSMDIYTTGDTNEDGFISGICDVGTSGTLYIQEWS